MSTQKECEQFGFGPNELLIKAFDPSKIAAQQAVDESKNQQSHLASTSDQMCTLCKPTENGLEKFFDEAEKGLDQIKEACEELGSWLAEKAGIHLTKDKGDDDKAENTAALRPGGPS
jgi:hypothetical protein